MRLICPRCRAEYEIEDALIPESGREVECSNCNHLWFQLGRLRMPAPISTQAADTDIPPQINATHTQAAPPEDGPGSDDAALPPAFSGPELPDEVLTILRDEAAYFHASNDENEPASSPAAEDVTPKPEGATGEAAKPAFTPRKDGAQVDDMPGEEDPASESIKAPSVPGPELAHHAESDRPQPVNRPQSVPPPVEPPQVARAEEGRPRPKAMSAIQDPAAAPLTPVGPKAPDRMQAHRSARAGAMPRATDLQKRRKPAFRDGFMVGLLIIAALYAAYTAAPHIQDGPLGDMLQMVRATGDRFHVWLQGELAQFR